MNNNFQLESERLILKVLDESNGQEVLEYFIRNRDFLNKWEPVRQDEFYTLDNHMEQLKSEFEKMQEGRLFKIWVFEKEDKDFKNVLGSVALNEIVRGCFHSCFLGYRMDNIKTNRGYITEAVKRVIEYAFDELKLHRIEANIIPENGPSLRVVEKLGFYNEGLAIKYLKINGKWEDHIHMVIRNEAME